MTFAVMEHKQERAGDAIAGSCQGPRGTMPNCLRIHKSSVSNVETKVVVLAPACDMDPALEPPRPPMRKLQKGPLCSIFMRPRSAKSHDKYPNETQLAVS